MGLREGPVVAAFVGRLERQKGLPFLFEALARPQADLVHVALCGSGSMERELRDHARRLGIAARVHFAGWCDDVGRWIGGSDFLVLPSLWESFGLVNLEAMAWSKPVCASRTQGVPEVVVDGSTGLLVPPGDVEALAHALGHLASDPALRTRLGAAGRVRYDREFTYRKHLERHLELYRQVVAGIRK